MKSINLCLLRASVRNEPEKSQKWSFKLLSTVMIISYEAVNKKTFWCAKRVAKWLSDVITKEQANFCDHKAYGSKLYFCRELRWDNKFSFPEKYYNPKTFFQVHFLHHLVIFIPKGDCSSNKATVSNARNFWFCFECCFVEASLY